jgi:GntR family transcriptional regulator, sialic acid-inducible nan operon repressor
MERRLDQSSIVQIPKAAQVIAETLRRRIVLGDLAPGDALPNEPELMSEFGVSRASLREALRILEAESLIEVKRGAKGGARVCRPSDAAAANTVGVLLQMRGATLAELLEALEIIEPPLMAALAARRTDADLEVLRAHVERERALIADFPAFSRATTDLHRILGERSKNAVLALILGMLDEIFRRHAPHFVARSRPDQLELNEKGFANHAALVDMIAARNGSAAEAVWRAHMGQVKAVILSELGEARILDLY